MASVARTVSTPSRRLSVGWLIAALLTTSPGCGWWNSDEHSDADESLPDLHFVANEPAGTGAETPPLRSGFQPGERFGFRKTVEQTLTQDLPSGPAVSRSLLELTFDLSVESAETERSQFRVLFHRVRYMQELSGRRVEYDSQAQPSGDLPAEVRLYQGLVDNGFAFSVPIDGAAMELKDVNEFVERCIQHLPDEEREAARQYLTNTWTVGMASALVDEIVRLIPPDVELAAEQTDAAIGRQWSEQRTQPQPVPMTLSTTATLRSFQNQTAEFAVTGHIAPLSSVVPAAAQNDAVRLSVQGGQTAGSYTVDRRTRLPVRTSLEQRIDMQVVTAGGEAFDQHKRVLTTIQAAPAAGSTALAPRASSRPRPIRPAIPIDASNRTPRTDSEIQRR